MLSELKAIFVLFFINQCYVSNGISSKIIINNGLYNKYCKTSRPNLSTINCTIEKTPLRNTRQGKHSENGTKWFKFLLLFYNVNIIVNTRIVGGEVAKPYSWPAEVFILIKISGDFNLSNTIYYNITNTFACGGTLISPLTVISAAHCFNYEFTYVSPNYRLLTVNGNKLIRSNYPGPIDIEIYAGAFNTSSLRDQITPPPPAIKLSAIYVQLVTIIFKNWNLFS